MFEKLNILKKNNYNPDGIIDIGANSIDLLMKRVEHLYRAWC